ncbi:helix-turn-helix transcriptional regulator [Streptomyces sp. BPTC-684]|uniref:helix-turn-helix domain-containing protein n=1 Tax=Streptomyces sp. BPTC-684 TaxID=3043734 RepID=UPI0024B0C72D|nr:helix-turn-helix transcriptional regulator [Streptomyces sp. BPTC-684]WHM35627.1 helix-turn-helix transcriptional regulator [Streptomyces sp. BPTC-684]
MFDRHAFTARRVTLGLSVEELADEMMVARSTVYRWENGDTSPSLRMLVQASRHLCVPLLSLMNDDDTEQRRKATAVDALLREGYSTTH